MKTKIITLAIVTCCWACLNQAQALPITIEIAGIVTSASGSGLPDTIYEGVSFTGTYTYDSSTLDSDTSTYVGRYYHNSPYGVSLFLGGYEFKTAPNHVGQFEMFIGNDLSGNGIWDEYWVRSWENVFISPVGSTADWTGSVCWYLSDSTHTAFSLDTLPVTVPILMDWDRNFLEIYGYGFGGLSIIEGTVTQVLLIPEPLTGVLMVMGVLFLRRRR